MKYLLSFCSALGLFLFSQHLYAEEFVAGEFVVRLKGDSLVRAEKISLERALGGIIKRRIPGQNVVVVVRPSVELVDQSLKVLNENKLVQIAEPNFIYRSSTTPNDPMFSSMWGLGSSYNKADVDISAEKAWDIETGSENVIVAVIDSGIDATHEDLVENFWINEAEANGVVGVDDDQNGYVDDVRGFDFVANKADVTDDFGHGSHCAGIIGARGNNGVGITGVTWKARLMNLKILDHEGKGSLDSAIAAVDYATRMGAKVISNSWGGRGFSENLRIAIENSSKAGAVFVAAAGNDSSNNDTTPTYPSSYVSPNVISVAATDLDGDLASFSNYGKNSVHVGAPGVSILSTFKNGDYYTWSGTSMATPFVAGIAALLISHEPELSNVEIKKRILETSLPSAGLVGKIKGRGIANAYTALTNQIAPPYVHDPVNWNKKKVKVSSPHPYKNNTKDTYEVEVPGAKQISIYFEKFETYNMFDRVQIYDSKGSRTEILWGDHSKNYSAAIAGSKAKIVFTSDRDVTAYGFDISHIAWR